MTKHEDDPWVDEKFENTVRNTAYFLWERDGSPEGTEKHYWLLAVEQCLKDRREEERMQRGLVDPI
ncbi:MAG: DUF2934 domain-containing protein [Kaiparowitsia implicata GSE-PSE-MK54-09C]|nr:DUF2934 domain-containing protein [Kaiparowitsia implicata GSE-PSE-MK54-09C]